MPGVQGCWSGAVGAVLRRGARPSPCLVRVGGPRKLLCEGHHSASAQWLRELSPVPSAAKMARKRALTQCSVAIRAHTALPWEHRQIKGDGGVAARQAGDPQRKGEYMERERASLDRRQASPWEQGNSAAAAEGHRRTRAGRRRHSAGQAEWSGEQSETQL